MVTELKAAFLLKVQQEARRAFDSWEAAGAKETCIRIVADMDRVKKLSELANWGIGE